MIKIFIKKASGNRNYITKKELLKIKKVGDFESPFLCLNFYNAHAGGCSSKFAVSTI